MSFTLPFLLPSFLFFLPSFPPLSSSFFPSFFLSFLACPLKTRSLSLSFLIRLLTLSLKHHHTQWKSLHHRLGAGSWVLTPVPLWGLTGHTGTPLGQEPVVGERFAQESRGDRPLPLSQTPARLLPREACVCDSSIFIRISTSVTKNGLSRGSAEQPGLEGRLGISSPGRDCPRSGRLPSRPSGAAMTVCKQDVVDWSPVPGLCFSTGVTSARCLCCFQTKSGAIPGSQH